MKLLLNSLGKLITGADSENRIKVFTAFLALNCLMASYYFIKPLRKGLFFSEFSADLLPYFHLGVIILVLICAALINVLTKFFDYRNLLRISFGIVLLINLFFTFLVGNPNKLIVASFSIWASSYFPLCVALFWGGINQNFTCRTSKQSYAFIWIGAIIGAYAGSQITSISMRSFGASWSHEYQLMLSIILLTLTIVILEKFFSMTSEQEISKVSLAPKLGVNATEKSKSDGFINSLIEIFSNSYVRNIAIIVICLTFSRGVFDLQSDYVIERQISKKVFNKHFLVTTNSDDGQFGFTEDNFDFVHNYKRMSEVDREASLKALLSLRKSSSAFNQFKEQYQNYIIDMKNEIILFNSDIWSYQNVISLGLLLICKLRFIQVFGLLGLLLLLPLTYLTVFLFFATHINLEIIFILKVTALSLDYSLNNAAKEILYVPLDERANTCLKPVIEGPLFKIGATSASGVRIFLDQVLHLFSLGKFVNIVFIITGIAVTLRWIISTVDVSKRFYSIEQKS